MSFQRKARRWLAVSSAAAATALTLVGPALGNTQSQYTGGADGTPQQPVSGNFSNGFVPAVPAGGSSTLELDFANSGSNSFTGLDDLTGTLNLNEIQLNGTSTGMGSISANPGNSLNFLYNGVTNPVILQDNVGQWTLGAPMSIGSSGFPLIFGGSFVNGATAPVVTGNVYVTAPISGTGGQLVFSGVDNTILQAANSYTGTTTLNSGTLTLDFSAATAPTNGNILYNGVTPAALVMAGGSLVVNGNAATSETQTLGGLTLGGGGGTIVVNDSGQGTTLALGAITRTVGGGMDFSGTGTVTTTTLNKAFTGGTSPATILGGWATFGNGTTWAVTSNTAGTNPIAGLATYSGSFTAATDVDAPIGASTPGAMTINSLRFNNAGAYAVSPSAAITVASGGILETSNVGANAVVLGAAATTNTLTSGNAADLVVNQFNTAGTMTINSILSGAIGLTKTGPGTLILGSTANTFTGDVYLEGGTLQITGSNGNATSGPLGIFTGGTSFKHVFLNNDATFAISSSYNVNVPSSTLPGNGQVFFIGTGGGQFNVASGATFTIDDGSGGGVATSNAEIQGPGDLTKIGPGTLSLGNGSSNFSVFTGQIFIDAGTVQIGTGTFQLGATSAGTFINSTGILNLNNNNIGAEPLTLNGTTSTGVLVNNGTGTGTASGPINLAGANNYVGGAGTVSLSGVISGGGLTKVGNGTLILSNANTYTGGTTVSGENLNVANGVNGSATGTGPVALAIGTTLISPANGAGTISGVVSGPASGATIIAPGGIYPTGGVVNSTLGTLYLGGLNATANTSLTFDLNNSNTAGSTYDTINILNVDGLTVTGTVPIVLGQLPAVSGIYHLISFDASSAPSFDNSNFSVLASSGNGRVTYTVSVDPVSGNQYFVDLTASGNNSPITTVFNNPTPVTDGSGNADWTQSPNWSNGVPGVAGDVATLNNGATGALSIDLNGAQHVGSLTLANSGGGSYTLAAGTGTGAGLYMDTGSTSAATLANSLNNNTISAPVILQSPTNVITAGGTTLTMGGVISGGASLTSAASSAGTLILGAANTYSGGTNINGGTVQLAIAGALPTAGPVVINAGGTLDINNFAVTNAMTLNGAGVGGGGAIINSSTAGGNPTMSGGIALGSDSTLGVPNNYIITGVISGAHALTVIGPGQLSLNASNTFNGGLVIGNGTGTVTPGTTGSAPTPPAVTTPNGFIATGTGDLGFGAAGAPVTMNNGSQAYVNVAAQVTDTHSFFVNGTVAMGIQQNQKWLFNPSNAFTGPGTATIIRYSQTGATTTNDFQLAGANPGYSGAWILEGGATEAQSPYSFGNNAATNTVMLYSTSNGGADELASNNMPQAITSAGPNPLSSVIGADNNAATATYTGPITLDVNTYVRMGAYFATTSQNIAFTNTLSGPGSISFLTPNGGTLNGQQLILSGNNIGYGGAFTIPAGVALVAGNPNALGSSSTSSNDLANTTTLASGAALDIQTALAGSEIIAPVSGTGINNTGVIRNTGAATAGGSFGGPITLGGNATFGVTGAGGLTLFGIVSDQTVGYTLSTVGTNASAPLVLSNGNNSFGGVVVQSGTTQVNAAGALGSANVTVGNTTGALNATLQLGGFSGFTLANNITVGAGSTGIMTLGGVNPAGSTATYGGTITSSQSVTLDSTTAGATTAFAVGIGGSASIVKGIGAGTVQLQGVNSYSGTTTVNGGVLQFLVGNGGIGAVTVNHGGTLAGFGGANVAFGGNLTVNLGGVLAPGGFGNTTGGTNLSLGGNLVLNNGSTIDFNFAGGGAGPALENIVFNSSTGTFTINGDPGLVLSNAPTSPGAYTLFNMTQDSSNLPSNASLAQIAISPSPSGLTYVLQQGTGNDLGDIDLIVSSASASSAVFMPNGVNPVGGNSYSFNTGANWTTASVPNGSGSSATFPNVTTGTSSPVNTAAVTLDAAQHVGTLTLNPGAGFVYAFTAGSGGSLAIDTNLTNSSGANTLAAPVSFTAPATVFVDTSTDGASSLMITSAGSLASGNMITKTGDGLFNVAGPATLTGGATISAGTLQFSNTATGTSANSLAGTFSVASGATLRGSAVSSNIAGSLSNALNGATISLSNGGVLALNPQDTTSAAGLFVRQLGAGSTGTNTANENYTVNAAATSLVTATSTASSQTNLFASSTANTGYDLTGKVLIPTAGTYTFGLNADDGARLFIDGQLAVNDDVGGGKGQSTNGTANNVVQQTGIGVALSAGYHDFNLEYTNTGGGGAVEVTFAGPGNINTGATTAVTTQTAMTYGGIFQPVIQTAAYNPLPNAIVLSNNVSLGSGLSSTIDVGSTNTAAQRFVGVELNPSSGAALTLGNGSTLSVTGSSTTLNPTTNLDAGQFLAATSTSLVGGGTITISNAADVYLGGLTDNGTAVSLVKSGAGQLVLDNNIGGANSLVSGSTVTIQQGRLHLYGSGNTLGSAGLILAGTGSNTPDVVLDTHSGAYTLDNAITVSSNAKIEDWNDTLTTTLGGVNGISLAGGKTLTFDAIGGSSNGATAGATLSLVGLVSGSGGIAVQSTDYGSTTTLPGVVIFQNPLNSFSGGLTVNSGTATASGSTALNSSVIGTGPITLLTPTTGTPSLLNLLIDGPGSSTGSTQNTLTFGGATPDPVTVSGTGSTTINVANNGTNINNIVALGNLTIGSATLNVIGGNGYSLSFPSVSLGGTPTFAPASANLLLGPITGTGSQGVTVAGSGSAVAIFNGPANYTGAFTTLSGTARLGVPNAINPASALLSYGGTLDLNGQSPTAASFTTVAGPGAIITNNGATPSTLTISGGTNVFSGNITDGPSAKLAVVLNGGTTQLAGFNSFSGGLTVNSGATLVSNNVSNALGINPFGAAAVNLNGGSLNLTGQLPLVTGLLAQFKQDAANPVSANYSSLLNLNTYFAGLTGVVSANTTAGGKTDFNYSNNNYGGTAMFGTNPATATTANYGFAGTANFDARFTGYITITLAGTYTFSTTSDDGSVVFVGSQNTPVVNNNAFQGATTKTGTFTFPTPGIYPITVGYYQGTGGEGLLVQMTPPGGTATTLLQSQVESPGSTYNAAQTYSAPINVTADSTVNVTNSLGATVGPISIGSSTLSLASGDTSGSGYGLATGAVTITGSPTFNVANSSGGGAGTLSVPSIIGGATNGITKIGPAILQVTGGGSYGGATNVQGGTLLASNPSGSATGTGPVNLGDASNANAFQGVLGGSGRVAGMVNVYNGSTISAGTNSSLTPGVASAVSTLNTGPQTWFGGGTYTWKLANAATSGGGAGTPGSDWDLINMSTFHLDSSTNGTPFQINVQPLNGTVNSFNPNNTYTWQIAHAADGSFASLAANQLVNNFALNTSAVNAAMGTLPASYQLATAPDAGGSELEVVYSPAPEPTSLAMLGLAAGGLLLRRRRRQD